MPDSVIKMFLIFQISILFCVTVYCYRVPWLMESIVMFSIISIYLKTFFLNTIKTVIKSKFIMVNFYKNINKIIFNKVHGIPLFILFVTSVLLSIITIKSTMVLLTRSITIHFCFRRHLG